MSTSAKQLTLGLDIGGTQIKALALKDSELILGEISVPSRANENPSAVRAAIRSVVETFMAQGHHFDAIGIGCAGSVDSIHGIIRNSPNFSNWKNVPLVEWIKMDFSIPVFVDNDANCATLSEWHSGNAKGYSNVVLLTLGTGIGGGLILNDRLYRGSTGTGGELGHFSIRSNGIECPCGNRGCFERYCSASALKSAAPQFTAKEIFELATKNAQCQLLVQTFLADFKVGMASIANIFDPDIILLGGAVSFGLRPYLDEISQWVKTHAFPAIGEHIRVNFTKFENRSGALGAALLSLLKN